MRLPDRTQRHLGYAQVRVPPAVHFVHEPGLRRFFFGMCVALAPLRVLYGPIRSFYLGKSDGPDDKYAHDELELFLSLHLHGVCPPCEGKVITPTPGHFTSRSLIMHIRC